MSNRIKGGLLDRILEIKVGETLTISQEEFEFIKSTLAESGLPNIVEILKEFNTGNGKLLGRNIKFNSEWIKNE